MREYRTVGTVEREDEFIVHRSRFIGCACRVSSEAEAMAFLAERRQANRDASHNVWAYRLAGGILKRCSDDGEPQGTGGVPVLDVLEKENLEDVAVVVTRYFGGTLLGAGGLVRAYSHGAKLGVLAVGTGWMRACTVLRLELDYALHGKLSYLLGGYDLVIENTEFAERVTMDVRIPAMQAAELCKAVREQTGAVVNPVILAEKYEFMEEK